MEIKKLHECLLALKDLKQSVKCPVCLEIIKDTVELKCEHRICRSCFQLVSTEYQELKKCPLCKIPIDRRDPVYKDLGADAVGSFVRNLSQKIEDRFKIKVEQLKNLDDIERLVLRDSNGSFNEENTFDSKKGTPRDTKKTSKLDRKLEISKLRRKPEGYVQGRVNSSKNNENLEVLQTFKGSKHRNSRKTETYSPKGSIVRKNVPQTSKQDEDERKTEKINAFDLLLASTSNRPRERKIYINRRKKKETSEKPIKLLEFQDNKNRLRVVEWLNDNKNKFERLTLTQTQEFEHGPSEPFNLPSVSQLRNVSRAQKVNIENLLDNVSKTVDLASRSRARSLDLQLTKCASDDPKIRRHSFAGDTTDEENYCIDEFNTEEDKVVKKAEEIALIDLMEDEYLNTIDNELLHEKPVNESKRNTSNPTTEPEIPVNITSPKTEKKASPDRNFKSKSNKENKSVDDTGWSRLKDIKRTIRKKEKVPKKLKITLQSTPSASKNTTQTSHNMNLTFKSKLNESIHKEGTSYDLDKVEHYFNANIEKIQENFDENRVNTSFEKQQDLNENRRELVKEEHKTERNIHPSDNRKADSIIIKTEPLDESSIEHIDTENIDIYNQATQKIITHMSSVTKIPSNSSLHYGNHQTSKFQTISEDAVDSTIESEEVPATQKIIHKDSSTKGLYQTNSIQLSKSQQQVISENIADARIELKAFPNTEIIIHDHQILDTVRPHETIASSSIQLDLMSIQEENLANFTAEKDNIQCSTYKSNKESHNIKLLTQKSIHTDTRSMHTVITGIEEENKKMLATQKVISEVQSKPPCSNCNSSQKSHNFEMLDKNSIDGKLQKGCYILNLIQTTLKSYASEIEKSRELNEEQLSLPSKLDNITKPVSIFLNLVPLFSKLDPFIHQLKDIFKELQGQRVLYDVRDQTKTVAENPVSQYEGLQDQSTNKLANMSKNSDISNYLTCSDISVQTVHVALSNKEIQTDLLSPEGFLISANEVFKTPEMMETGIQTESLTCPQCKHNFTENVGNSTKDELIVASKLVETQKLTGRYTLTEFFEDLNFETQDIIKQAQKNIKNGETSNIDNNYKTLSYSQRSNNHLNQANVSGTSQNNKCATQIHSILKGNSKEQSQNKSCEISQSRNQKTIENKKQSQQSDNISRDTSQKFNQVRTIDELTTRKESHKSNQIESADEHNASKSSVLVCSVSSSFHSKKRKRLDFLASDSENEDDKQIKKQPCNKFVEDDFSVVFESEKPSPTEKNFNPSDESDDGFNYEEYIAKALKKYDDNGVCRSGNSKTNEQQISLNKKQSQDMIKACNKLIGNVTRNMTPEQENSNNQEPASSPVIVLEDDMPEELAEDIFLDEHNISKIERDISEFEKISNNTVSNINNNVNSENTDIIPATEGIIAYDKVIQSNKSEKAQYKTPNSLSENLFSIPNSGDKKQLTILEELQNRQDRNIEIDDDANMFVDSDSDQDTEVISNSFRNLNTKSNPKITLLQNLNPASPSTEKRKEPSLESDEEEKGNISDGDIVDTTPQKKRRHLDIRLTSQRSSLSFDIPLPPPPGFGDDDDTGNEEQHTTAADDLNVLNNSSVIGDLKDLEKSAEPKQRKLETSTPYSQKPHTEDISTLSPIPARSSMNIIELVKQSKFSPLSVSIKPASQKLPSLPSVSSIPKQQSILSYFGKSQEKKSEGETKSKPCVACTRLTKDQVILISSMTNKKLASYSNAFGDNVTHMIVSVNDRNCVKDHTTKYILAVASGIWVLSFKWVQECLANNCIVPEEPFEVLDSSGIPGPKLARTTRLSNPLLKGYKIHAAPPFTSTTQHDVEKVIYLLGGKVIPVVEDIAEDDDLLGIIITEASHTQDLEIYEVWLETFRVVTVDIEWLSKSVGQYNLVSLRSFALCSDDSICDMGYPEALVGEPLSYPENTY